MSDRVADIFGGPWSREAMGVRRWLRSLRGSVDQKTLSEIDVFLPHWKKEPSLEATDLRRSFDEALTPLQLAELAVASSYVDLDIVRPRAIGMFKELLWLPSARAYVNDYDYVSVRFLAARLGVDLGLPPVDPPAQIQAPTIFAVYLAQFREWYRDPKLDAFLDFLDDFVLLDGEADKLSAYLITGEAPADRVARQRLVTLVAGLDSLLRNLDGMFSPIPKASWGTFGILPVYWLAAIFGYRLESGRYERQRRDWSGPIRACSVLTDAGKEEWLASLNTAAEVWAATREVVERTQ